MSEADERFAEALAEDLKRYLGPQLALAAVELGDPDEQPARIRATCVFEGGSQVLEVDGATRLDAYNELILRLTELRLAVAARFMDEDALTGFAIAWQAGFRPEPPK